MIAPRIILASASPRRKQLASEMGLKFEVIPSKYEEDLSISLPPEELVMEFAYGKASDVANGFKEGIVIGMDTIVFHEGKVLGKPKDRMDAFNMLKSYSGKSHKVFSGICLINCLTKQIIKDYEVTEVSFAEMNDYEINKYLDTGDPLDKAGAYGVQNCFIFIEKVSGCYFNVVGFPARNLYKNLKKLGVDILDFWQSTKPSKSI
jgi:septum formation protein